MFVIKCPKCGSYYVSRNGSEPRVRFKCKMCSNGFSLSVPLPNHREQGKRIPAYIGARIVADMILGKSYSRLRKEYRVGKSTLARIRREFKEETFLYIWRVDYKHADFFWREIERGILRQGWGKEGMDLRGGEEAFAEAFIKAFVKGTGRDVDRQAILRRFNILKVMLAVKPGDYVLVPKMPNEYSFTLLKVREGYDFAVAEGKGDYGHMVKVERLGEFSVAFEELEDVREFYDGDVQWVHEMLRCVRGFHSAVAVVDKDFERMYKVVGRLAERPNL
ncbi:MAG: IS1 family transposase [Thermotogae bacterium]|nr:IS1 family transposase [Thermotogota bacterium]